MRTADPSLRTKEAFLPATSGALSQWHLACHCGWPALVLVVGLSPAAAGWPRATAELPPVSVSSVAPVPSYASAPAGCSLRAQSGTMHLSIGGHPRLVIVHVPTGYRATVPTALVLNMHGSGSTAREQEMFSGMNAAADRDGFIVAYPQGVITSGAGFAWNVPGEPLFGGVYPPKDAANDVVFLTDLVTELAAVYCIDTRRVFATGVSGGGRMASQLACDSPGTFAAVAPVAGLRFPSPCPSARPVPVIAFHGTADPVDPYAGHGQAYWAYSVPTAAKLWAAHDRCRLIPHTASGAGYTLSDYRGCARGGEVELYTLIGEGHEWPGGPSMPPSITAVLGPQSQAVDANTTMWAFFVEHSRP